jgi:pimeloyl-ACP methyl ester carboxylesterase
MKLPEIALLLLLCSGAAHAADERAPHRGPVKVVADQRLEVRTPAGAGALALYLSRDWNKPQADVGRVVIVIHGRLRDADVYLRTARAALAAAGDAGRGTLLVVPQFLATPDIGPHGLPADTLRWQPDGWMGGETAVAPAPVSSFEVIDAILSRLADRALFPKLAQVVLAGHSGGGQVVQRYAVVGTGEAKLAGAGVKIRYVVANPSSYLYFSAERPASTAGCAGFDHWKYGWQDAPDYARRQTPAAYEQAYIRRDVFYLLGMEDTDPRHPALDKSCAARAQGAHRLARGRAYVKYLMARDPATVHRMREIPGVGHDGDRMLTSACGLAALFDLAGCPSP